MQRGMGVIGLCALALLTACDSSNQRVEGPLPEGVILSCGEMYNELGNPRTIANIDYPIWRYQNERLTALGWREDDPLRFVIRHPDEIERANMEIALHSQPPIIEFHNSRDETLEPVTFPALLVRRGDSDSLPELLGYDIDPETGMGAFSSRAGGPFDGERQLPPEIEQRLIERYDLNSPNIIGPWVGECRMAQP